jgi:membrane-bound inhibitor of C-type lysozyme
MSILALIVPLIIIPFSFKVAGGLLGRVSELAHGYGKRGVEAAKGNAQDGDSWRNRTKRNAAMLNSEAGLSQKALTTRLKNPTGAFTRTGRAARKGNQLAVKEAMRAKYGRQFSESDTVQLANAKNDQYQLALADDNLAQKKLARAKSQGNTTEIKAWEQAIAAARVTPKSSATRLVAANAVAASGFHYSSGREGYNELAETMADITGATLERDRAGNVIGASGDGAGAYANAMNNAQYNFRTAGRFDLGGINNGEGFDPRSGTDKGSLYELANAKKESITAMVEGLGAMPVGEQHAVVYKELQAMLPNAKGANRDEVLKQMQLLQTQGVDSYLNTASGRINPATGAQATRQQRINYDSTNAAHAAWNADEKARGWRTEQRAETKGDLAQEQARSYERPNPDQI